MVLGVYGCPVPLTVMKPEDERDNPYIQYGFEDALELAKWYQKDMDCPTTIVMLSVLAEHITPENLDSPMLDYVPQQINAVENAYKNYELLEQMPLSVEGKAMKLLSELGWLIDKAKEDQAVGGKKE